MIWATIASAAHPRSRGENLKQAARDVNRAGSSPLTRGKRERRPDQLIVDRLIPAHAGKTQGRTRSSSLRAAHPRSRGENSGGETGRGTSPGSSPLTRGKLQLAVVLLSAVRLIPAHAGKTQRAPACDRAPAAHPRSRGENHWAAVYAPVATGSSPLTRGKLISSIGVLLVFGLIPAHAGKTDNQVVHEEGSRAHPRSRGENRESTTQNVPLLGSSPLTRGKLRAALPVPFGNGLIPAHAGKTVVYCLPSSAVAAHPRSRGENQQS